MPHATTARLHSIFPVWDKSLLRGAMGLTLVTLIGFGFLYSLTAVGVGQALFPYTANGSLIERDGQVIGSALVAQPFTSDTYFQPRPSASHYDLMSLAGSNQARTNPELRRRLADTRLAIAQRESVALNKVPADLFTQSGSGIDPHISPASATLQAGRIAHARGLPRNLVDELIAQHTEPKQWRFFGQTRVNVLTLNLALDALSARVPPGSH